MTHKFTKIFPFNFQYIESETNTNLGKPPGRLPDNLIFIQLKFEGRKEFSITTPNQKQKYFEASQRKDGAGVTGIVYSCRKIYVYLY